MRTATAILSALTFVLSANCESLAQKTSTPSIPAIGPARGLSAPPAPGAIVTPSAQANPASVQGPGAVVPPQTTSAGGAGKAANLGTEAGVNDNPLGTGPAEA